MLKKIDRLVSAAEERILQVFLGLMILITVFQAIGRALFKNPIPGSDELVRYLFVWVTYLASSYAVRTRAHLRITALESRLSVGAQWMAELFVNILCLLFSLLLFIFSLRIMWMQFVTGQESPMLRLPMQYAYMGLSAGGLFMTVRFLLRIAGDLFARKKNADFKVAQIYAEREEDF